MNQHSDYFWIETVVGSRKISNIFWAITLLIGAIGFLLTGLSSYIHIDIVYFFFSKEILFIPQGVIMSFYGIASLFISLYLWCIIGWNVGSGYNELDRENNTISIFRWGFPGDNRRIRIRCSILDVQAISLLISKGIRLDSVISLRLRDEQYMPFLQFEESVTLKEIEEKAALLAHFLNVPIEDF